MTSRSTKDLRAEASKRHKYGDAYYDWHNPGSADYRKGDKPEKKPKGGSATDPGVGKEAGSVKNRIKRKPELQDKD